MVNSSSSWWVNSSSSSLFTSSLDLHLPLVPSGGCASFHGRAASVTPPVFLCLAALGLAGNAGVLWACLRPARPWSIGRVGTLNLALCDLVYLCSVPPTALQVAAGYDWRLGRPACLLVLLAQFVGVTAGTMFICAVSLDRFLAIAFPLESRLVRTPRNAAAVSAVLWCVAALLAYLAFPSLQYRERPRGGPCYCGVAALSACRRHGATYSLLSYYAAQVSLPLLLILPSYARIARRVAHRDRALRLVAAFVSNFLVCWVPGQLLHMAAFLLHIRQQGAMATKTAVAAAANTCGAARPINLLLQASQLMQCLNACLDPVVFHLHCGLGAGPALRCQWGWGRKLQAPEASTAIDIIKVTS